MSCQDRLGTNSRNIPHAHATKGEKRGAVSAPSASSQPTASRVSSHVAIGIATVNHASSVGWAPPPPPLASADSPKQRPSTVNTPALHTSAKPEPRRSRDL